MGHNLPTPLALRQTATCSGIARVDDGADGQQRVGTDQRQRGTSSSSVSRRSLPRRRRRRRRSLHRTVLRHPHPASRALLRVQRDRAVRHAQLAGAPHVLPAEQLAGEGRARTHRLSDLLHVHAARRRGGADHVRIYTSHRYRWPFTFLGRLLRVDLITLVGLKCPSVRPSVHKMFLRF